MLKKAGGLWCWKDTPCYCGLSLDGWLRSCVCRVAIITWRNTLSVNMNHDWVFIFFLGNKSINSGLKGWLLCQMSELFSFFCIWNYLRKLYMNVNVWIKKSIIQVGVKWIERLKNWIVCSQKLQNWKNYNLGHAGGTGSEILFNFIQPLLESSECPHVCAASTIEELHLKRW